MENLAALLAALATSIATFAHGALGYRWLIAQMGTVKMRPTELSIRLFGGDDVSAEVLGVTWHVVTAMFLASAVVLYLSAFGALQSKELLRFIAVLHAVTLVIGFIYMRRKLYLLRAPIPMTFSASMVATASFAWIASNSV
jgi:hypothetical protein